MDIDKIAFAWRQSSQEDLEVAKSLYDKRPYAYCLFFCHLAVEKMAKPNRQNSRGTQEPAMRKPVLRQVENYLAHQHRQGLSIPSAAKPQP